MAEKRNIVSAIEIGSSKICVLIGELTTSKSVEIIGQSVIPSENCVIKGEIEDMPKAFSLLSKALEQADQVAGKRLNDSIMINVLVSGCAIESHNGIGTVFIKNEDNQITQKDLDEAQENGKIFQGSFGRDIVNSSESYFKIDDRKVYNPLNHTAQKLDAYLHVVHGDSNRLKKFRTIANELGFDNSNIELTFSPFACNSGVLTEEESENGVILIDIGAGCTEYIVECNKAVIASGIIQIGFNHVYNDLALGLGLKDSICRKLTENGAITKGINEHQTYLDLTNPTTGRTKKIPLNSVELIVDARLREIFEIIHHQVSEKDALSCIGSGGIITGGGALFDRTELAFRNVFDMICRVGTPLELTGATTGLNDPRFSAIWGALKIIPLYLDQGDNGDFDLFENASNKWNNLWSGALNNLKNIKGALKF